MINYYYKTPNILLQNNQNITKSVKFVLKMCTICIYFICSKQILRYKYNLKCELVRKLNPVLLDNSNTLYYFLKMNSKETPHWTIIY